MNGSNLIDIVRNYLNKMRILYLPMCKLITRTLGENSTQVLRATQGLYKLHMPSNIPTTCFCSLCVWELPSPFPVTLFPLFCNNSKTWLFRLSFPQVNLRSGSKGMPLFLVVFIKHYYYFYSVPMLFFNYVSLINFWMSFP